MTTAAATLNRAALADWYRRNRQRSRQLFDIVRPEAYYSRPISLRHPIVFYEGHLPAFSVNTLLKKGLGRPGVRRKVSSGCSREASIRKTRRRPAAVSASQWPTREGGRAVRRQTVMRSSSTRSRMRRSIARASAVARGPRRCSPSSSTRRCIRRRCSTCGISCRPSRSGPRRMRAPTPAAQSPVRKSPQFRLAAPPLGAPRGRDSFWVGQRVPRRSHVDVPAFGIDAHNVTNETVHGLRRRRRLPATGTGGRRRHSIGFVTTASSNQGFWSQHDREWQWRDMFEAIDLPPAWPVYVSQAEAAAYARWKGGACRPKPSTTEPPSATHPEASGSIRGVKRLPMHRAASSTSRPGARSRPDGIPRARAPGACTT